MTKWQSGPPPSMGWWPCKIKDWSDRGGLRWWNGNLWSWPAFPTDSAKDAERYANKLAKSDQHLIEWTERPAKWPKRSRT